MLERPYIFRFTCAPKQVRIGPTEFRENTPAMKTIPPLVRLLCSAACVATLMFLNGCERKPVTESDGAPPRTPPKNAPGAKIVSAEKNSFAEVTSHLDPGGSFYLYLSTEQWMSGLSGKVSNWKEIISAIPEANRADADRAFGIVTRLIKDSGIEDVSGVGMSSIAREPDFYRTRAILHHYQGQGKGFLWNMTGRKPHSLTGLDLLPANTVLAAFSDLDPSLLWSVIQKQARQSGVPQAEEFLNKLPENFENATAIKWEQLLASLGGEFGLVVTFDETKRIPIPLPQGSPLEIPEPGLMLVIKVNDDTIFQRVDQVLKDTGQQIVSVDEPALKMRTMAVPLPIPIELRPTMATTEGYLLIATTDALIRKALAVKTGKEPGLRSTAEFKRLAVDMPVEGNQFLFLSPLLGQKIIELQQQALTMSKDAPPGMKDLMQAWLNTNSAAFFYSVTAHTDEGWVLTANGNQGAGPLLMGATIAPAAIAAAMVLPAVAKAKDRAQQISCRNNLRIIELAKHQWAVDNNKGDSAVPTGSDLLSFLPKEQMPACPSGGDYSINAVSEKPTCSHDGHGISE
jgi:hypothetical protein